jgi:hypothetical protein
LPLKDINDFEEFKNYGRMINAPCVIIADFEADNKKWDYSGGIMKPFQTYGGNMRKIMEPDRPLFGHLPPVTSPDKLR